MRDCKTAAVELTQEEVQNLDALPYAAHAVKQHLLCELEDGHAGPHWALAQCDDRGVDGVTNWWLRWSPGTREWAHNPTCSSESCLLPSGHGGAHR